MNKAQLLRFVFLCLFFWSFGASAAPFQNTNLQAVKAELIAKTTEAVPGSTLEV